MLVGYFSETVSTRQRAEIVDITGRIEALVKKSSIQSGICIIYVPHTTAAVSINENADPDVKRDVLAKLEELIPQKESYYQHGEGNSDSHLKTILSGPSVTMLVEDGALVLGRWQGVYFCEFDGPRRREYFVKVMEG
jgi:secondary thiamine-phosphate synthase enzyme